MKLRGMDLAGRWRDIENKSLVFNNLSLIYIEYIQVEVIDYVVWY